MSFNCSNCGGQNTLPKGRTSMYCVYCGSSIQPPFDKVKQMENPIKTKPIITSDVVSSDLQIRQRWSGYDNSDIALLRMGYSSDLVNIKKGAKYEIKTTKNIEKRGGELKLTNRGIFSLSDVIEWFTDNELESIRVLDLSNNNIFDLSGLERFKNIEILILSHNKITEFPFAFSFKKLFTLDLSFNQLSKFQPIIINDKSICSVNLVNNQITELIVDIDKIRQLKKILVSSNDPSLRSSLLLAFNYNPIQSTEFFEVVSKECSSYSSGEILNDYNIRHLSKLLVDIQAVKDSRHINNQIELAQEFVKCKQALHINDSFINKIMIFTDFDLQPYGYIINEKTSQEFRIDYPPIEVCLDSVKLESKFAGDVDAYVNKVAATKTWEQKKGNQYGIWSLILIIAIVFCLNSNLILFLLGCVLIVPLLFTGFMFNLFKFGKS